MKDDKNGWSDVPPARAWICPQCKQESPVEDWREGQAPCEDCGEHDARFCPKCDEGFDHVWGARDMAAMLTPSLRRVK